MNIEYTPGPYINGGRDPSEGRGDIPIYDLEGEADAADEAGLDIRDYSGRGMYGNETLAVRFDDEGEYGDLMAALPKAMRRRIRCDSLGRGSVAYLAR